MTTTVGRPPADLRIPREARAALRRLRSAEGHQERAAADAEAASASLALLWEATCARFARDVPQDALLLDVLAAVTVEDGDVWLWHGMRNNKNLPVLKAERGREMSVIRYLAIAFGVIEETTFGLLYPGPHGPEDINPFHRELRHTDRPMGNPARWGFGS